MTEDSEDPIESERELVYTLVMSFDKKRIVEATVQDLALAHLAVMAETTRKLLEYRIDTENTHWWQGTVIVGGDVVTFRWADTEI